MDINSSNYWQTKKSWQLFFLTQALGTTALFNKQQLHIWCYTQWVLLTGVVKQSLVKYRNNKNMYHTPLKTVPIYFHFLIFYTEKSRQHSKVYIYNNKNSKFQSLNFETIKNSVNTMFLAQCVKWTHQLTPLLYNHG